MVCNFRIFCSIFVYLSGAVDNISRLIENKMESYRDKSTLTGHGIFYKAGK